MRARDLALEGRIGKVIPRVGDLHAQLVEDGGVRAEAQRAYVDAGPYAVRILLVVGDCLRVRRLVRLDQAIRIRGNESVRRAAPPDAELRGLGAGLQSRERLARAQADIVGVDAELLLEALDHDLAPLFLWRAEDGERVLQLGRGGFALGCR